MTWERILHIILILHFVIFAAPNQAQSTLETGNLSHPAQNQPSFTDKPSTITTVDGAFLFTGLERGTHQVY
ncbi:MAG: hypothetical protein GY832_13120, partial [Chloroflexi bacterium]|nr:hypothetical protein [Chloroflexota bacterium]